MIGERGLSADARFFVALRCVASLFVALRYAALRCVSVVALRTVIRFRAIDGLQGRKKGKCACQSVAATVDGS